MPLNREQKENILNDLIEKFKKAKSIIFSDFRGLPVKDIQDLRRKLKEKNIDYTVAKKTLIKLAAEEIGIKEIPRELVEGPCAAAFSYEDEVAPAKIIKDFSKSNANLKLLGGIMEGKLIDIAQTMELASLPSYEELLAKFMGSAKAPISGFHGVLYGVMRQFVGTIQALHDEKSKA